MLKIRLQGLEPEINQYIDKLDKDKSVKVLSQSEPYKNRGKTEYVRVYVDIELEK